MKSLTTGELKISDIALRARNGVRMSLVLIIAFLGPFGLYLYLALTRGDRPLYVLAITTFITTLLNILALHYSRQRKVETAAYLMIASLILLFPVVTVLLSGVGITLGISTIIGVFLIATLVLNTSQRGMAIFIGTVVGVAILILDVFFSDQRLEIPLLTAYIPIIAVAGVCVFAYYFSQEFSNYPLRTKLILFFVLVAVFSVGAVAIITNILVRNSLTQLVGRSQQDLAERLAFETGKELGFNIDSLQAAGTQFEETVARKSNIYVGENDAIVARILALDERWSTADDKSLLIRGVVNDSDEIADELREFQEKFPHHVELFVTDKYGANIAATNRTSDYYQADEEWWQIAYNAGRGKVYIGQPEFDESSQTYSVILAIPLISEGEVVGILRSTLDAATILENLQGNESSTTTEIDLRIANDTLVNGDTITQSDLLALNNITGEYGQITYKGKASLVNQEKVFAPVDSSVKEAVSALGWSVIVHRSLADALQSMQRQTQVITLTAIFIILLVVLLGFLASQRLAAPILTLTDFTRKVSEGNLSIRAQATTQDEIGDLATSFNRMTSQLQDTLGSLERRVAERTADLELARLVSERRAQELQAISEISRTISTEQRLEILLPLVTRLVSERFDFYHVGIFFVDPTHQYAVLQAANSEGGKRMLEREHRLAVGTGIVGTVSATGKPRIALDVGSDAVFFDNPDLPNTRSEMALPLNFRGETIGVLDVQSIKPGAFTDSDTSTLSILADQVAIAIENARLFGQTQQAREEAEALYNQFLRTEWKTFLRQDMNIGYRQTINGGKILQKPVLTNEIQQALRQGRVVVLESNGDKLEPTIAVPVKLREQTIGVLNITGSKNRRWSQDEITLAQAISDRLALALDNARLLQESQRQAAKEAKIGEVTAKIGASINMRNVLQTAVEELGRALPGSEIVIQFQNSQEN